MEAVEQPRSGAPSGEPEASREVRWSARRKEQVVLRLLRGEEDARQYVPAEDQRWTTLPGRRWCSRRGGRTEADAPMTADEFANPTGRSWSFSGKREDVEVTDVTQAVRRHPRRLRRWLAGAGVPPSLRAQLVLMVSAFLLGGVLAAVLFVGVWRQTAVEGARARAAQLANGQQLFATQRKLAAVEAERAHERAALAKARVARAAAAEELTRLRRLHAAVARSLGSQLPALATTAGVLAHDASTLASELAALRAYLRDASATGIDSGFLDAQISYLVRSTDSANSVVARLEQQTQQAQAAAAKLGQPQH